MWIRFHMRRETEGGRTIIKKFMRGCVDCVGRLQRRETKGGKRIIRKLKKDCVDCVWGLR